jgi:DNA mismatch repair ATPase MutL
LDRIENKISSQKTLSDLIKQTVSKLLLHLRPDSNEQIDPTTKKPSTTSQKSPADGRASANQSRARNGSSDQSDSEDDDEELLGDDLDEAVARELAGLEAGSTRESSNEAEESRRNHSDEDVEQSDSQSGRSDESQSLSGYSSESSTSSPQPAPTKKAKLTKLSAATRLGTRASSSTFLPALNVGYTLGDSDASDLEIDDLAVDKMERERGRKNRRGQQARRASVYFLLPSLFLF